MWQDWVIMSAQWVFAVTLLMIILHKDQKPPFLSSLITSFGIYAIAFAFATLGLWLSSLSAIVTATEWAIIAYQRYRLNKSDD